MTRSDLETIVQGVIGSLGMMTSEFEGREVGDGMNFEMRVVDGWIEFELW